MRSIFTFFLAIFPMLASSQAVSNDYLMARALMIREEYDSALYHLDRADLESPGNTDILYNRGLCYFETNQLEKAIPDFMFVNTRRKGQSSIMLARAEARLNHPREALHYLKEHLSSSYKLPEKEILLEEDFARLETESSWKSLWKEKDWYSVYDRQLQEVDYLKSSGNLPEAINQLNDLNDKGYKRTVVNQYLAELYLLSGNRKAALESVEKSVRSDSRNTDALKLKIILLVEEGKSEEALRDCDRLLRQAPDEFEFYLVSGNIDSKIGNYDDAVESVKKYISFFPQSSEAFNQLGIIHYDHGKYINAISAFNKSLALDPGKPQYFFNRGRTYAATKMFRYAEMDFSMALDLDPNDAETWYQKGLTDQELGNIDIACFDFRKALQLGKFESREYVERLCGRNNGTGEQGKRK